jgi:hypothetical protein
VRLERLNWNSPSLLAHAVGILAREALGIDVEFSDALTTSGAFRRVGTGEPLFPRHPSALHLFFI